ncbi:DUF6470 family protein [Anaerospora hongkongensis]|uniref:DUF6470 family protein n=1 Tax=Anaerospora hongkongensis TaxID=244830 RepID=UPI00289C8210|nr:DUF6470 family protein [Anaerospora hongkongensis]
MVISNIRLHIESQPAKTELNIQKTTFNLSTTPATLSIETEPAIVEITSRPYGTLEIDQSPCRASMGIKDFGTMSREAAEKGKQAVLDYMANHAQIGDRMAKIKEDVISNVAAEVTSQPMPSISWGWKDSPIIRYTANPVKFNPQPAKLDITSKRGTVDIDYREGEVGLRMTQYPSIRFWTTGGNIDLTK